MSLPALKQAELNEQKRQLVPRLEVVEWQCPKPLPGEELREEDRILMNDTDELTRIEVQILQIHLIGRTSTLEKRREFLGQTTNIRYGLPSGSCMYAGGMPAHTR